MGNVRQYEAGEVIFNENDTGETAYVIEQGRVEVLKNLNGANIHIAYIGAQEPFGEMGMIDEKPRSATVVAVERTTVRELHRDDFVQDLQAHPELTVTLLKVLFERLREADSTILQIYRSHPDLVPSQPARLPSVPAHSGVVVTLQGLTARAVDALPERLLRITEFPFRVGRWSPDKLVQNDLSILDEEPWQISRNHLAFIKHGDRIGVSDRGSRLGSTVDGVQLGGERGRLTTIFLTNPESTLVLGNQGSPYEFKVSLSA
jgi:CRP/FNR family cyclic AMP-dependent transcriptional regulator